MPKVFGTPKQRAMQRRAEALWHILKADRRILCHGRLLSVSFETPDCVDLVMSLAHLQGSAGFENVPNDAVKMVQNPLHHAGLHTEVGEEWRAGAEALRYADQAIARQPLPDDLTLRKVSKDTSDKTLAALERLCMASGEWLPMEEFLRGNGHPSAFLYLTDPEDRPIAMGGCVVHANRYHPREEEGFWGMLAIDPAWSGRKVSLTLGAYVMRQMRIDFGTEHFSTIIRPGQEGFKALCRKLGFTSDHCSAIYVHDPSGFVTQG